MDTIIDLCFIVYFLFCSPALVLFQQSLYENNQKYATKHEGGIYYIQKSQVTLENKYLKGEKITITKLK